MLRRLFCALIADRSSSLQLDGAPDNASTAIWDFYIFCLYRSMPCHGHGCFVLFCSLLYILDLGEDGHPENDIRGFEKITDMVILPHCEK